MLKEVRKLQKIKRKSFFPTLIITLIFWIICALIFFYADPEYGGAVTLFIVVIFLSLFFTASILLVNKRRGFLISLGISLMLLFRMWGVGNIVNMLLLAGMLIAFEIYSGKKQ